MGRDSPDKFPLTDPLEALRVILPEEAFSEEELREVVPLCEIQHFEPDAVLITEGEVSDNRVYFILEGSVSVYIQTRFILKLMNRGDTIGEMGLISSAPRSATVKTNEPSSFLIIDATRHYKPSDSGDYKFRYFLSRIFSTILTEKLRHTSNRAKLYEDMATRSEGLEKERMVLEGEIVSYLKELSLFTHLVNSAKDIILILDTSGNILNANPSLKDSFDIETNQVLGVDVSIFFGLPDRAGNTWASISGKALQGGWNGEVMIHHPKLGQLPADCSISAVDDMDGNLLAYSVILRDIRERRALEEETRRQREELEDAYRKLRELDLAKSNFLNLVSHELRTPISSILAYSELLNTEGMVEPEDQTQFIDIIHHEADKLADMVKKILAIAKMESGQMLFSFSENQVEEMVRYQVSMMRGKAQEKNIVIDLKTPPSLRPIVFDEENLREAVGQILDNAIRFTDGGTISVCVSQNPEETLIRIQDTGKGIEGRDIGELLDKFARGDEINIGHHGLGLGLPLCYLIVQAHSGSLSIESNSGKGTTVSIVLPTDHQVESVEV